LTRARRARSTRGQRAGAVALVAVVAVVGGLVADRSEHHRGHPRLPTVPGYRGVVVVAASGGFVRADFGSSDVREARPPAGAFVHSPTRLVRRRDGFAFATDGKAFGSRLRLDVPLTSLGPALDVFPARDSSRVWVVDPTRTSAREVDLHGRGFGPSRALPADAVPVAGVEGGWLVDSGTGIEVRDIETGTARRTIAAAGSVLDATPTAVLWRDPSGSAHVNDLALGSDRVIASGTAEAVGALAPTGHHAALISATGAVIVDDGASVHTVPGLEVDLGTNPVLQWSADSTTLLLAAPTLTAITPAGAIATDLRASAFVAG